MSRISCEVNSLLYIKNSVKDPVKLSASVFNSANPMERSKFSALCKSFMYKSVFDVVLNQLSSKLPNPGRLTPSLNMETPELMTILNFMSSPRSIC